MTATSLDGLTNWSGSHRYRADVVHRPTARDELADVIAAAEGTLQVLGTRHSFTAIGDADALVDLTGLPDAETVEVDVDGMTATVGPSVTYAGLARALAPHGLAVANMASLPHITVAGAVATASHGSGDRLANLATHVRGLEIVAADGETHSIVADDPRLPGAAVHLGALGAVVGVTVALVPAYELRQDVYLGLPWGTLADHFDEVMGAGRSVSVFHDLGRRAREVWVKADADRPAPVDLFGAPSAVRPHSPLPDGLPDDCTAQLGVPGPWSERLPHFRSGHTPSSGEEIQSEYFVAQADGIAAIEALRSVASVVQPVLRIAELRTIAADELWLSPHQDRDSVGLHFTWRLEPERVRTACAAVEDALAPLAPRPHWGKLFTGRAPELPRAALWRELRSEFDPRGVFANDWLRAQGLADG